ncbi:hypothetical protein GBA52_029161 [Prunus armeniaca]|nr:hypothetical protein GBA52_029161 [Prunus armeniaca]
MKSRIAVPIEIERRILYTEHHVTSAALRLRDASFTTLTRCKQSSRVIRESSLVSIEDHLAEGHPTIGGFRPLAESLLLVAEDHPLLGEGHRPCLFSRSGTNHSDWWKKFHSSQCGNHYRRRVRDRRREHDSWQQQRLATTGQAQSGDNCPRRSEPGLQRMQTLKLFLVESIVWAHALPPRASMEGLLPTPRIRRSTASPATRLGALRGFDLNEASDPEEENEGGGGGGFDLNMLPPDEDKDGGGSSGGAAKTG